MTPFHDFPVTMIAVTVWAYWSCVVVLVVRSHLRFRTAAGSVPRTSNERRMWAVWVPAIILWQIFPAVSCVASSPFFTLPTWAVENPLVLSGRWFAAAMGVVALGLTIPCWLGMGRNWSMAIVPGKKCRLITSGMFSYVRHPIYALSIMLMLATMVVTLTPAMTVVGLIHITMLFNKSVNEERYLTSVHGEAYSDYCQRTGRFVPRLFQPVELDEEDPQRKAA